MFPYDQKKWLIHVDQSKIVDVEIRDLATAPAEITVIIPKASDCAQNLSEYEFHKICSSEWNSVWKNNRFNYVPDNPLFDSGADWVDQHDRLVETSFGKLNYWKTQFLNGGLIPMPVYSADEIKVKIGQGRHRIALMRILGLNYFYAAVPKSGVENMKNRGLIVE